MPDVILRRVACALWVGLAGCNCNPGGSGPVIVAPAFTVDPTSFTVQAGQDATFSATATGVPAPTVSWFILIDPNGTGASTSIDAGCPETTGSAGSTTATCTWTGVRLSSNGTRVLARATNPGGTANSAVATLTVTSADVPAAITSQPQPQSVVEPATATFSAAATGAPTPTLQWQVNADGGATWSDIAGATGSSYTTPATSLAQSGWLFRLKATNQTNLGPLSVALSDAARLTVTASPPANALVANAVVAGYQNSFAIDGAGDLWGWGAGVAAANGGFEPTNTLGLLALRPVKVQGVAGVTAFATSGVQYRPSFYALLSDGTVSAWGSNLRGQLGDGTTTDRLSPVKVRDGAAPVDKVCSIAATNGVLALVRSDEADGACGQGKAKRAWVAGLISGSYAGGLPAGTGDGAILQPVPLLPSGIPVRAVIGTRTSSVNSGLLFFLENGAVYAWGWNTTNCLGGGGANMVVGVTNPIGPVDVSTFWADVVQVETGFGFALARGAGGGVVAVGRNAEGELGVGTMANNTVTPDSRLTLASVPGLAGVTAVTAGYDTALAVAGGELYVWGHTYGFTSGVAFPFYALTPIHLAGPGGVTAVSLGDGHALALGPGGIVYAWGYQSQGALGDGTGSGGYVLTPTLVTTP